MRTILTAHQTNPGDPFIDEPGILAGAEMPIRIDPAGKDIIIHGAAPPLEPSQQAESSARIRVKFRAESLVIGSSAFTKCVLTAASPLTAREAPEFTG